MIKPISIIVAIAENNAIGKDNQLLWHLPEDLKRFKQITRGHSIIMGRKTFDSLPKGPLPERTNIVVTKKTAFIDGCLTVHSIEEALVLCEENRENFVIGGESVYKQFLDKAQKLYITKVHARFEATVFFPAIDYDKWTLIQEEHRKADEKNPYDHSFLIYERKSFSPHSE